MTRLFATALWVAVYLLGSGASAQDPAGARSPEFARALAAVPVAPGALFALREIETQASTSTAASPSRVLRRAATTIDASYLTRLTETANGVGAGGQVDAQARAFTLNLMPDVTVRVVKRQSHQDELGNTIWQGVPVEGEGAVTLVIRDGRVTGEVHVGGQTFGIAPAASDHAIVEYRESAQFARDDLIVRQSSAPAADTPAPLPQPNTALEKPAATPAIGIMVAYTAAALKARPDIQSQISLALADLRTTLSNSGIAATVTLVGTEQVNYTEVAGEGGGDVLYDADIGAGDFARIRALQKSLGADILSVWSQYNDNCGVAYGAFYDGSPASVSLTNAAAASINTVSADCSAATFTHEVGHLLGANHERYVVDDAVPGPTAYNYGYVDLGYFRDVMSYGNECSDKGVNCPRIQYFSNPNITYQGRAVGVSDSKATAADNARKITEVLPYAAQLHTYFTPSTRPVLSVARTGSGTITDSSGDLTCGTACNLAVSTGSRRTLTAVADPGWEFTGWSGGGCSGTASTCSVTVNASVTIAATFVQSTTVRIGAVYSSSQSASQSFLRLYNTDTTASTVSVALLDYTTGTVLGRWTSPAIAPGAERQFSIAEIEAAASPAITSKPQFYAAAVDSNFGGYFQHVLWHVSDNSLTNLTTCSSGAMSDPIRLMGVHSTLLGAGYPSSIVINNTGTRSTTVTLDIYDALTGSQVGTFPTGSIAARGERIYTVAEIEQSARFTPSAGMYHYVVQAQTSFTGHIAHLMQNVSASVVTDMSTVCPLRKAAAVASASQIYQGAIFSSAQAGSQSFLRFMNAGNNYGSVNVLLSNPNTGVTLAQWSSGTINTGAALQVPITTIEAEGGNFTKPDYYTVIATSNMLGEFQHVLWHASDGTLTNLTTCTTGTHNNPWVLGAVHTSKLGAAGYPSTVIVTNTGASAARVTLTVKDASDGSTLGTYRTASIPAGAQAVLPVSNIEAGASPRISAGSRNHYVIAADGFAGYLQHQLDNAQVGVITDMTTTCGMQP